MSEIKTDGLNFEKVWAMFQESDRKFQAMAQETREQFRETRESLRESLKETEKLVKENSRQMGLLHNRFGELAEHLVAPGIVDNFNSLGFWFSDASEPRKIYDPKTRKLIAEVDLFLENGDIVIAVEIKATMSTDDVNDHLARMKVLRRHADSRGDRRKYRGAMAGAIIKKDARSYALKSGFYVIEQSGDTMKMDIPEGFVPQEW